MRHYIRDEELNSWDKDRIREAIGYLNEAAYCISDVPSEDMEDMLNDISRIITKLKRTLHR